MYLTKDEERLLESSDPTVSKCMEILVALGEIFEAERLIPVKSAHISGISYANIGDEGLEWIRGLRGKFRVRTTLNPCGMDLERWREMGVDDNFARKQFEIVEALLGMGAEPTFTCTPYLIRAPSKYDHLAWSESSAIVIANSVYGAMTNRESGISALASAVIGKTPLYGMHIKENRRPTVLVKVEGEVNPAILGYELGREIEGIPIFEFKRRLSLDEMKQLGAALAATGGVPMFHVIGQTPEWSDFEIPREKITVSDRELKFECEPDLIAIGCPHLSERELAEVWRIAERYGCRARREIWLFTSRFVYKRMEKVVRKLEMKGVKVFRDTCMVVCPVTERFECVMVNSGKALAYLPKLRGVEVAFGKLEECVRRAFE